MRESNCCLFNKIFPAHLLLIYRRSVLAQALLRMRWAGSHIDFISALIAPSFLGRLMISHIYIYSYFCRDDTLPISGIIAWLGFEIMFISFHFHLIYFLKFANMISSIRPGSIFRRIRNASSSITLAGLWPPANGRAITGDISLMGSMRIYCRLSSYKWPRHALKPITINAALRHGVSADGRPSTASSS